MRIRALLLLGGTLAAAPAVGALAAAPVARLGSAVLRAAEQGQARPLTSLPLDDLVAGLCGLALLIASAAWTLALLLAVAETAGPDAAKVARAVPCPALARSLALGALGLSLGVAAPVAADGPPGAGRTAAVGAEAATPLVGLALPERVPTTLPRSPRAPGAQPATTTTVRPGDTLWSIAAAALPDHAGDAVVDRAWRRVAAANADVVRDAHLIFPGTELRVPPLDDLLGKDLP